MSLPDNSISMHVLQISSDFANQKLYDLFVTTMSELNISQTVYIPVRRLEEMNRNINPSLTNITYNYSYILNKLDRINYFGKIEKTTKDLLKYVDVSRIDLCHSHFLFSDGGIALELKKKFNIPYIVAVRNTDLNVFFKYLVHVRRKGLSILLNAERIVFLSEHYKSKLLHRHVPRKWRAEILKKSVVIPNGIDEFWLQNIHKRVSMDGSKRFLYVGNFSRNKNVDILIKAVVELSKKEKDVHLTLVGGGGNDEKKITSLCHQFKELITYKGKVDNKMELLSIYRQCNLFVMASSHETFGLVYVEAMSQGLPIIYTINEGISGYFPEGEVGYGVRPRSSKDIIEKSQKIFSDWLVHSHKSSRLSSNFSWKYLSTQYLEIYNAIQGVQ